MPVPALICIYLVLAGGLVFLSDKLGNYIDLLDKKTSVSGAFLGGVLLAAVTSLPELFTSISATLFVQESDLVVGNVLGSNLFNVLVLGLCLVLFFKLFQKSKVDYKSHFFTLLGLAIIYPIICFGLLVPSQYQPVIGPINIICPLILVVYGLIIYFQPKEDDSKEEEAEEKEDNSPLTVKQILFRFIICAVVLVAVSIVITYVTDALGDELGLDATVAGALFLAVATSLPELVSCISLCRRGNFNAGIGDIVGSCFFNFVIIGIAEFLSYKSTLISQGGEDAIAMTLLAMIVLVVLFGLLLVKKLVIDVKKEKKSVWFNILTIVCGLIAFSGYIVFLII